ncbi:MAG: cob(I)yrinic acid a,c-diamide adenosyltransferase [Fibrobacter sp.]|nr:cob(I)yrinic acid a,c-diamide adenosyltransferase [Fibrobacter sp.]
MSINLTRIYTRGGDKGKSSLATGERVSKSDLRLEAYGSSDELNCQVGRLRATLEQNRVLKTVRQQVLPQLAGIQDRIFDLGTMLATTPEKRWKDMPQVSKNDIATLEAWIDQFNADLQPLKSFVLPGTSVLEAEAQLCRAICRRVERILVRMIENDMHLDKEVLSYINRLSDYFFVVGRWIVKNQGLRENLWSKSSPKSKKNE